MHARSVLKSTDPLLTARAASLDGRPALVLGELGATASTPDPRPEPERPGIFKRLAAMVRRERSASVDDQSAQGAGRVRSPARIGNAE